MAVLELAKLGTFSGLVKHGFRAADDRGRQIARRSVFVLKCGQANIIGETFCTACGVALEEDGEGESVTPLEPLPIGTVLADAYRVTALLSTGQENRYRAVRQTADGQTYLIAGTVQRPGR